MSASCVVLPKLIDIKMPDKQDKSYWEYNALKALDYNTEIVWVAHISAAPNEIKKLVYSHYKRVIFKNIKRAFLCINKSLAKKCANRLKGIKGFGVEYIVLSILLKFAKNCFATGLQTQCKAIAKWGKTACFFGKIYGIVVLMHCARYSAKMFSQY